MWSGYGYVSMCVLVCNGFSPVIMLVVRLTSFIVVSRVTDLGNTILSNCKVFAKKHSISIFIVSDE